MQTSHSLPKTFPFALILDRTKQDGCVCVYVFDSSSQSRFNSRNLYSIECENVSVCEFLLSVLLLFSFNKKDNLI